MNRDVDHVIIYWHDVDKAFIVVAPELPGSAAPEPQLM